MQTKLSAEQIAKLLESSCDVEGYQELSWRNFLQMMLRELIYEGQDFKGVSITGDDEWYEKLMDAIAKIDPSLDGIAYAPIFCNEGHLDQILDFLFKPTR